jgi:hypothetical protein
LFLQIKPFRIVEWATKNNEGDEDDQNPEYFVLPAGRDDKVELNSSYKACVIVSGFCPCSLVDAYGTRRIIMPKGVKHVHLWSDSDLEKVAPKSGLARRKVHYTNYFPGVTLEPGVNRQVILHF